jgi:penicillin-binding protein 1C
LQELVESIVSHHKEILQVSGINNISVIIVETETGKIRVWVGSQDFQDKKTQGEIDGVLSPRSTGSLLKPFLYSLSIDRGFILPDTILRDIPSTFGNYSPMNANGTFMGVVTAKQALINSLNVPSVRLLSMFGVDEFYDFLKKAGLNHLWRTSEDYGLPLILGGAEASPYEIATLYYGLANGGNFSEISWLESKKRVSGKNLISKGSAYLILNVLRELKRPGLEELWNFFSSSKPIAWKTGTSYGYKDAWAAGVTPSWVVVVWSGNFDGTPNPLLSGAKVAGSIMIDIINALPIVSNKKWFEYPKNDLVTIEVCAETGYAPGPNCPRKMVEAPVNMIPLRLCPFHKVIYTTLDGKYSVCSSCWEPGNYVQKVMLIWPPDIAQYLRENGVLYSEPPPHKPECKSVNSDQIEIIYPQNGNKIVIPRDFNGQYQKVVFRAATSSKKTSLYWYIDGELIGTTSGYHLLAFLPEPGVHKITIVEKESGQVSSVTFTSILAK